jgi:hypothetical protein
LAAPPDHHLQACQSSDQAQQLRIQSAALAASKC